jgi:hypothetical protein
MGFQGGRVEGTDIIRDEYWELYLTLIRELREIEDKQEQILDDYLMDYLAYTRSVNNCELMN